MTGHSKVARVVGDNRIRKPSFCQVKYMVVIGISGTRPEVWIEVHTHSNIKERKNQSLCLMRG